MEKFLSVLQVIVPIFAAISLGVFARRRGMVSPDENRGLQQFVMKIGLPCTLFNSCLNASMSSEAVTSMALVLPIMLLGTAFAFWLRKRRYTYHNLPMMFAAQESGMLGIPLFITLFGVEQAYRIGVLDLAQTLTAIPMLSLLGADAGENPSPAKIAKQVLSSPFLIASLSGLLLNLSGAAVWLNQLGIGGVITEATTFLAQPVSAVILFSVGYNFSLALGNRNTIFRLSLIHFTYFAAACLVIQGILCLFPAVEPETRWAVLLFCALPPSFLSPSLGRTEQERTVPSSVCSILTLTCLMVFCAIAAVVA